MISKEIIRKFVADIKSKHEKINESTIEKDFYLTLFLNEISNNIEENKESIFSKLVFKGGTLLTRTHLNYHRISEDLDFTYSENNKLKQIPSKQRKKFISALTNKLVAEIYEICKKFNLDFSTNKKDKKYCVVMDRKSVYSFKIHYSPIYGAEESIKFEVNFNDEIIYPPKFEDIKHLFDNELIQDLEFSENIRIHISKNILCYDLREIILEKIRAILTRPVVKERDIFDLFLISKKTNIGDLDKEKTINKILGAKYFIKGLSAKIKNNLNSLDNEGYEIIEEKNKLALIDINEKDYIEFKRIIVPLITEIGKESLLKLGNL